MPVLRRAETPMKKKAVRLKVVKAIEVKASPIVCGCGDPGEEAHVCPFDSEFAPLDKDLETCYCCGACTYACQLEI